MTDTRLGLERFIDSPPDWSRRAAIGLLTHPPAVDRRFVSSAQLLTELLGENIIALFGPQHGFWGDKQDNMVESPDGYHPALARRIHSLYGEVRQPTPEMLDGLEVLLVDLQDVGTRVYTYIHTLRLVMEACGRAGVKVAVLDRPNPIGRTAEGNLLDEDCFSFVGLTRLPMRHGLTLGEAARMMAADGADCELEVVTMEGYDPDGGFSATGLPWVMPSPNMPCVETALVYPGQVLWEGTNVSEGRGTTRPFEIFGAAFIDPFRLAAGMEEYDLPGVVFRPINFEPTFHKFAGKTCGGLFIHVTDPAAFRPYLTSLALMRAIAGLWPEEFRLNPPPYEYETERRPMDLILGRRGLAEEIITGPGPMALAEGWRAELNGYLDRRERFLLYRTTHWSE